MNEELKAALLGLEQRLEAKLKLPQTDAITRAEVDKIIEAALAKAHPVAAPAMVMPGVDAGPEAFEAFLAARFDAFKKRPDAQQKSAPWTSDYGKKFGSMRGFIKAVSQKSSSLQEFVVEAKASSDAMTEGTGSTGGFLVPTEFSYEVIRLLQSAAIIRSIARIVPMSTWKRTLPRQLTQVAVGWVSEFGTKGITKFTTEQFTQQAKVMAAIVKSSDELLRDSAINLQVFLAELLAEAFGLEEERVALAGKGSVGGGSDPFDGVLYQTGVVSNTMAGANVTYDDLINQKFSIGARYDANGIWCLHRNALKVLMKLKDANGQYLWHAPRDGNPGQLIERPYYLSDQLPTNLGAGANQSPVLYGDFKRYLWLSDREGIALKVSQDASDWVGGALDSAFMSDQTWMRWTKAMSIDVALGQAFAKMNVK